MWIVTKEAVIGLVRTVVPFVYASIIGNVPVVNDLLVNNGWDDSVQGFVSGGFVVVLGGLIYAAIRELAERFPKVGALLVFNTKPSYEGQ